MKTSQLQKRVTSASLKPFFNKGGGQSILPFFSALPTKATGLRLKRKSVLEKEGISPRTRVNSKTAFWIQKIVEQSTVLKPYISGKLKTSPVVGKNFNILADYAFISEYFKYLKRLNLPTGNPQQVEKEVKSSIWGFYDPTNDNIYLRQTSNFGSALHEAIHKLSHFQGKVSFLHAVFGSSDLNEGVTQYFTDKVLEEQHVGKMKTHNYQDQLKCAYKLESSLSDQQNPEELIGKAYFQGNIEIAKVLMKKKIPPRDFVKKMC